ncbi:MAG TPA: hypothetical protein VLB12_12350 [Gemmatimonadales bacterium]|nr:hypothetical protein [Gemmatimonadales bacterium]
MQMRSLAPALALVAILSAPIFSLTAQQHVQVPAKTPQPQDVGSLDGIMKAFYEVISGPPGAPRDWGRDRTLYVPDIRFVETSVDRSGKTMARVMTHQEFVDAADAGMVKNGFFESEIHRVTKTFGNITQILSSYETRAKADGPVFGRGINSLQIFWDGKRYWIASVMWDDEREGNPIPAELKGSGE